MNGVSIGRIVWYFPETTDGSLKRAQAAIITNVMNDQGLVNLSVFPDGHNDDFPVRDEHALANFWDSNIPYSEIPQPHTWCWPTKS